MCMRAQRWMYLEVWRWGLFLAGVAPAYWLSEAVVHAASLLVETSLFNVHNAMLMAMAVSLRARTPASMPCGCCGTLLSGACTVASMCEFLALDVLLRLPEPWRAQSAKALDAAADEPARAARAAAGVAPDTLHAARTALRRQLPGRRRAAGARAGACKQRSRPRPLRRKIGVDYLNASREETTARHFLQCRWLWQDEHMLMHIEHGRRYDNKHGSLPHRPQLARTPGPKIQAGDPGAQWAWNTVLKVLLCLVLFCGTDLLKTLAAKSLARTFHKDAHFAKMQDALEKARRADYRLPVSPNRAGAFLCTDARPVQHRLAAQR